MRCPNCGGIISHFLIANGGRNYYICRTGLTGIRDDNIPVRKWNRQRLAGLIE